MSRRGENIRHRKDGRWEARIIMNRGCDKRIYKSVYAKTYRELKQKLKEDKYQEDNNKVNLYTEKITFNQIAEQWLEHKKNFVKVSTYNKYVNVYQKHIKEYMYRYEIKEVTNMLLQKLIIELWNHDHSCQRRSSSIISCVSYIIKATMSFAQTNEFIPAFQLQIEMPPHRNAKDVRVFTREEQAYLEKIIGKEHSYIALGIAICLYTGIRIGELCAIKWSDIDFDKRIIGIHRTVQRIQLKGEKNQNSKTALEIMTPKTKNSIRNIPITSKLYNIIESYKEDYVLDAFIFKNKKGDPLDPRLIQYQFKTKLVKANLKVLSFHALRHTFATRCIELGMDIKTISEILGHSNVSTTLSIYVHSTETLKKEQMELLTQL